MAAHPLAPLLHPASVALIGASARPGSVGQMLLANLLDGGFEGPIYAVNPVEFQCGRAIWAASIADLPEAPALAIIATPAAAVPSVVAALGECGTRLAVVVSGGITRENGLRQEMLDAALPHGLRLIGPNCLGILLPNAGLNAAFARTKARPGGLALISQSGALVTAMLDWAGARSLGFSAIVSTGDAADVDMAELIALFAADPATSAIALYVEGLGDGARFVAAAAAASKHKPIVAIKAGRGPSAARAVRSHTGALIGSAEIYRAAFRRAGIIEVPRLLDLFDVAESLCLAPPAPGPSLAIVSNGGGAAILAVDALGNGPGRLALLSQATIAALDAALPSTWSGGNPVDIVGDALPERFAATVETLLADEGVDAMLVLHCPTAVADGGEVAARVAAAVVAAPRLKPVLGCWLGESNGRAAAPILTAAGIPVFESPEDAATGFGALLRAGDGAALAPLPCSGPAAERARAIADRCRKDGRSWLDEIESKKLLADYGIKVAPTRFGRTAEEVRAAAGDIAPPYAVKIVSPDLLHKSDIGGVRLGLADADAAAQAAHDMECRVRARFPDARIRGYAVETMIAPPHGHELIAGFSRDETFGAVLMVGAGGKAVEILDDKALELAPVDQAIAAQMLGRTRIAKLLAGYRDEPAADSGAVADCLVALSCLARDLPDAAELDINPLLVTPDGAWALDARIRIGGTTSAS